MTNGTKVFLALFALIVGVLVVYYGAVVPDRPAGGDQKQPTSIVEKPEPGMSSTPHSAESRGGTSIQHVSKEPAQPPRDAPPPRQPQHVTPTQPDPNRLANASSAGGLISEGIKEATGQQGQHAVMQIDNPVLPLLNLGVAPSGDARKPSPKPHSEPEPAATPSQVPPRTDAQTRSAREAVAPTVTRREYVIAQGDTFVSIADQWFGDGGKWILIARENPTVDPQRLKIGQKIFLPAKDAAVAPTKPAPYLASGQTLYEIQPGDTLTAIARENLGDGARWEEIFALNREIIGTDAADLKVGTRIRLPKR